MASKPVLNDIAELLSDAREQLSYFHELGIENIEACSLTAISPTNTHRETGKEPLAHRPLATTGTPPPSLPANATFTERLRGNLQPESSETKTSAFFSDLKPAIAPLSNSLETFENILAEIGNCTRCPLYEARTNIVHTDGNHRARLMFVGEAPGADEDAQGRPFVGRAGQLLTKIIEAIGFRREDVLIGNVNRCRPPANRPPTFEEATTCKPFLLREIAIVQPEVIVVLGNTAMRNLLDTKIGITKLRGQFQDYQGAKVMPTFHPAYLLRDPSKKKETWADLKMVRDYLESTRKRAESAQL